MSSFVGEGSTGPTDDRPLNDQEYQLLQRLLGDPLSIPIAFKTWLISFLEGSDLTLPMASILGLRSTLGITGAGSGTLGTLPAGIIFPYGGATAPTGALLCDGASYSRTAQSRLYAAIGTTYGANDGNSFNVPNLRRKVPVMLDTSQPEFNVLGKTGGETAHTLSLAETPAHNHSAYVAITGVATGTAMGYAEGAPGGGPLNVVTAAGPSGLPADGGGASHNNLQPYITLNFIIIA